MFISRVSILCMLLFEMSVHEVSHEICPADQYSNSGHGIHRQNELHLAKGIRMMNLFEATVK
jgi:hypothetical protein